MVFKRQEEHKNYEIGTVWFRNVTKRRILHENRAKANNSNENDTPSPGGIFGDTPTDRMT